MLGRKTDIHKENEVLERVRQTPASPAEDDYAGSSGYRALDEEKVPVISFNLLKNEYAFEINGAVEVLRCRSITAVPRTTEIIKGILSLRGEIIPIIDLKKRLGVGVTGECDGKILIMAIEDLKAGFIVDKLSGVHEVPWNSIVRSSVVEGSPETSLFVDGVISIGNRTINLLNLGKIINISC